MQSNLNIAWRGTDGAGFQYGYYREGDRQYRVDISLPGRGATPKNGPHKVYVQGEEIGTADTLQGAEALACEFFSLQGHKYLDREEPSAKRGLGAVLHALASRFPGRGAPSAPEAVPLAPLPGPEPKRGLFGGLFTGKRGHGR